MSAIYKNGDCYQTDYADIDRAQFPAWQNQTDEHLKIIGVTLKEAGPWEWQNAEMYRDGTQSMGSTVKFDIPYVPPGTIHRYGRSDTTTLVIVAVFFAAVISGVLAVMIF